MKLHAECIACLMQGALRRVEGIDDDARKLHYMQRVCEALRTADPVHDSAPLLDAQILRILFEEFKLREDYTQTKQLYNALLLNIYDALRSRVAQASDPLYAALQLSMAGNYIDFGVLRDIEPSKALAMLEDAAKRELDTSTYARFTQELACGQELVFLHDNCGEIVVDRLLLETIHTLYPKLRLLSIVRDEQVLNDATMDDARDVGLCAVCEVISNATPGIPGTQLDFLPDSLRERLTNASVILAKGQGNLETLIGCKLNVYYLLLAKCPHYMSWFGFPQLSGVFANERELHL